jgi:hypothetical protein
MNTIDVIYPYRHRGLWVFDDPRVGLDKEPFVAGADVLIDRALARKGIKGDQGFRLIFSAGEFPGYEVVLNWTREGNGGNWYHSAELQHDGWLCPALLRYFEAAPKRIYARVEAQDEAVASDDSGS